MACPLLTTLTLLLARGRRSEVGGKHRAREGWRRFWTGAPSCEGFRQHVPRACDSLKPQRGLQDSPSGSNVSFLLSVQSSASVFCRPPQWREDRTPERSANVVQLLVVSQSFLFFFFLLNQALLSEWCYETKVPTVTFKKGKNACWLPPCMTSWPGRLLEPGHMLLSVLSVLLNKVFSRVAPAGLHRLRVAFPDKLMKSTK